MMDYKALMGAAAIGFGAIAGHATPLRTGGVPVRVPGKPAAESRQAATNQPPQQDEPTRLRGDIAVEPVTIEPEEAPASGNVGGERADRRTYTVKKGDTLYTLAARFLGSGEKWKDIADMNPGLKPESIRAGQVIFLPAAAATNASSPQIMGVIRAQQPE